MTRKSVISVMTVKIIELDVCTAPPGTGDCATLWVVLRRAQDEGRSDGVFRLLPSAGVTAFRFDVRCSKHEPRKALALCYSVEDMVARWRDSDVGMRGDETGTREMSMSRLYFGKENARKGRMETQRSGHIGR